MSVIDRFEAAWRDGQRPDLATYFSEADDRMDLAARRELLEELVIIDMEFRWRSDSADSRPLVESYRSHFAELGSPVAWTPDLIAEEYVVRQRWGDHPSVREYRERFRSCWPPLREALARAAEDFIDAQVRLYHRRRPVLTCKLPVLLEVGRQRAGEPVPFVTMPVELGVRLIISPLEDRYVSRRHLECEPCGKHQVRITCASHKNPVVLADGDSIRAGESRTKWLPCLLTVGECAIRISP